MVAYCTSVTLCSWSVSSSLLLSLCLSLQGEDDRWALVSATETEGSINIAAIDNGLAFPFKHPDQWRACTYARAHTHTHIHTHTHTHTHTHMHTRACAHTQTHTCTRVHAHTHKHTCAHTHVHTHTQACTRLYYVTYELATIS